MLVAAIHGRGTPKRRGARRGRPQLAAAAARATAPSVGRWLGWLSAWLRDARAALAGARVGARAGPDAAPAAGVWALRLRHLQLCHQAVHFGVGGRFGKNGRVPENAVVQSALGLKRYKFLPFNFSSTPSYGLKTRMIYIQYYLLEIDCDMTLILDQIMFSHQFYGKRKILTLAASSRD